MSAINRLRSFISAFSVAIFALVILTGCTPTIDNYVGTWIGLDERNTKNAVVYEYQIAEAGDNQLSVRVIKKSYQFSPSAKMFIWTESSPRYFPAIFSPNEGGVVSTPFGLLKYDVATGVVVYSNINFIKKAKNSELKLKYVARRTIKEKHPEVPIVD